LPFTQRDIERCIRAADARGLPVGRIEVDPRSGHITITTISGEAVLRSEIRKSGSA
jgi:hypothetical protein